MNLDNEIEEFNNIKDAPVSYNDPHIIIHGEHIDISNLSSIGSDEDEFELLESLDDTEIDRFAHYISKKDTKTKIKQNNRFIKPKTKHKSHTTHIDWRGIPYRNYLGSIRPHFSKLNKKKIDILKSEMVSRSIGIDYVYADLAKIIVSGDPDVMYSALEEKSKIANARNGAIFYTKCIIGVSGAVETVLLLVGIDKAKDFTKVQLESAWMYRTLALELSKKSGPGGFNYFPTELKIGGVMALNIALYIGVQYFSDKVSTYGGYTKIIKDLYGMFSSFNAGPATSQSATASNQPSNEMPLPEEIKHPQEFDMGGMMKNLFSGFANMMNTGNNNNNAQTSDQPRRTPRARRGRNPPNNE